MADAVTLRGWCDPARIAAAFERRFDDLAFVDRGPAAASGWSLIGTGAPVGAGVLDEVRVDGAGGGAAASAVSVADLPAAGGEVYAGWLSYEDGVARAFPEWAGVADAGSALLRIDQAIWADHARQRLVAVGDAAWQRRAQRIVDEARDAAASAPAAPVQRTALARDTPAAYAALIERARDEIAHGNAYQLCLTTSFTVPGVDVREAFGAFLRLRVAAAGGAGGFVRIGGRVLASASPERFLDVRGGVVTTSPIKGTRPRAGDRREDAALAGELAASPKERAENVMIVDLMRNDLARVCEPGSVEVPALLQVEHYPEVHQLVSRVRGRPRPGVTAGELLRVSFPAGSMTGAPKRSAIEILRGLEGAPRGAYAGCAGWISRAGSAELSMVIRSIVFEGGQASVGAGGGITWGSDAAAEVAEVALKARAPLRALGASLPAEWGLRR